MKVMISQPMRGKKEKEIRQERNELVKMLEGKGYEVIDSIFADETPTESDSAIWYLAKSIDLISKVDGVVFMEGWNKARGCRIEHSVAKNYGKFIMYV